LRRRHRPRLVSAALLLMACGGAQRTSIREPNLREPPWTLTYADGAANLYTFSRASAGAVVAFEYVPVTPERSSTGHYSGGEPAKANLEASDPRIDELWRRVEALEADPALHTDARAKGTGAFGVTAPSGERQFIVTAGSALSDFHAFVEAFRR
jgi:hypothetical protein